MFVIKDPLIINDIKNIVNKLLDEDFKDELIVKLKENPEFIKGLKGGKGDPGNPCVCNKDIIIAELKIYIDELLERKKPVKPETPEILIPKQTSVPPILPATSRPTLSNAENTKAAGKMGHNTGSSQARSTQVGQILDPNYTPR